MYSNKFIVEDSLKEIKEQTNTALTTVSSQSKKVDESLTSLETVLKDIEEADTKRDKEFTSVKNDIDALKDLVPKVITTRMLKQDKSNNNIGIGA